MATNTEYVPITREDAVVAVLNGESLEGREISNLKALVDAIQDSAAASRSGFEVAFRNCRILECNFSGIGPSFPVFFSQALFATVADFTEAKFEHLVGFREATFEDGVDFTGATFEAGADFKEATFKRCSSFERSRFKGGADFSNARFESCAEFVYVTFEGHAIFADALFTGDADFTEAKFEHGVDFFIAMFQGDVAFTGAKGEHGADFRSAKFATGRGVFGNFSGANFRNASFNKCSLEDISSLGAVADLNDTNLENTTGLILDSTPIRHVRFSARAKDPSSQLRRAYTGPRFMFTVLLLVAFFTPYVAKTAGWVGVNRMQSELRQQVAEMREEVEKLESEKHAVARPLRAGVDKMAGVVDELERNDHASLSRQANEAVEEMSQLVDRLEREEHLLARPLMAVIDAVEDRIPRKNDPERRWSRSRNHGCP